MGERIEVGALRRADSYQPWVDGEANLESWPMLRTTGELAAFKNNHNRPVGPLYYRQPGVRGEVELMEWTPGSFRLLGRVMPEGGVVWVNRSAWMGMQWRE